MAKKHQTYFTNKQLRDDIFIVKEHTHKVFMPNEIFNELIGYLNEDGEYITGFKDIEGNRVKGFNSTTHIAYAYAYVYLAHYMYRYCKYRIWDDKYGEKDIDEKMIKQILGFPAKSDTYTYITKKGGVLDKLGYIRKQSDKPIWFVLEKNCNGIVHLDMDGFLMESYYPEVFPNNRNRKINYPFKGFWRTKESEEYSLKSFEETGAYEPFDGTFWDIYDTHMIDIDVFIYCMSDKDLGVEGFYLYSFLLYENDKFKAGFTCTIERLVLLTGLSIEILKKQLRNLEKRNMITNNHMPFCVDRPADKKTKANTYNVNCVSEFAKSILEWSIIPKQKKLNAEQYDAEVGFIKTEESNDNYIENDEEIDDLFMGVNPF